MMNVKINDYHPFRSPETKQKYVTISKEKEKLLWPVAFESKLVDTSFGQTYMRVSGPNGADPLVLLPGFTFDSLIWRTNVETLSKDFRVYAVDCIYDYGKSIYTKLPQKTDDLVEWLNEVFASLGFSRNINLVAHSYGAWLSANYALRYQENIKHLVIISPGATVLNLSGGFLLRGMLQAVLPFFYFKKLFNYWIFEAAYKQNKDGQQFVESLIEESFLNSKCFKPIRTVVPPTKLSDDQLKSIQVPTLFMVGDKEKIYDSSQAVDRIKKVNPSIQTKVIHGAGHGLTFSHPELINKSILEFITN